MRRPRLGDDRGSVVAEFAVALPAMAVVLLLCVGALTTSLRQVRLQDAVTDAARLAARGEDAGRVGAVVHAAVPGSSLSIAERDDVVCVTARAAASLPLTLTATACALAGGL